MRVRIKVGAPIDQDHHFGLRWPQCLAPDGGDYADRNMVFTVEEGNIFAKKGWLELIAFGFGDMQTPGGYGNGSIGVRESDVKYIDAPNCLGEAI